MIHHGWPISGCSYNDFTFGVGSTVGVTWICWSCCGVVMKHLNRFRMCLDWKISGSDRCRINIVVSVRYNLKIFNNSNSPPILLPKNRVYHDRIPTLNHLVNTELLDKRHPGRSPLLVPSHSKPSMMTVDTARWWQGEVGCFWVKSCSLTWKTAMILWLKTYVNSTWQRKIVTPSCKHNFIYSIFIVKCCWIFHCDGIKSWHTQRNFDIEHEAGRYLFQLERDEKELSRNNHPCVGLLNSFTISQKQVMMAQNPPVFLAAIHHINCRCPSVQQETMALR